MKTIKENLLQIALLVATLGTIGSLYFSEIMKLPPCSLCWYQRICMYPLVLILSIGIYKKDKNILNYALPLSLIGLGISLYHNLLYYGILPESIQPCITGISCTTKQIEWFGFVSIPLLALSAFILINIILLVKLKLNKE